jgi:hypothetical protein
MLKGGARKLDEPIDDGDIPRAMPPKKPIRP